MKETDLLGRETPESAKAVARVLSRVLPNVRMHEEPGWGHMAPLTHPQEVNARVVAFLRERQGG